MKKNTTLFIFSLILSLNGFSQNQFATDFIPVRTELTNWDAVRGEWLANSLEAMVYHQAVPQRTFPEDFTPGELLKLVPTNTRTEISNVADANLRNAKDPSQVQAWKDVRDVLQRASCKAVTSRSYGDPHLTSFDGASFSFQTVGEFTLAKSSNGNFEVQSRQRPQRDDFSLNTALALYVAGDRLCIYPNEKPDGFNDSPLRLNSQVIYMDKEVYFLPHGGTIRHTKRNYLVTWPTGETVSVDMSSSSEMQFMNLAIQVYPCLDVQYSGVMGNANRDVSDDFNTRGGRPQSNFISMVTFGNDPQAKEISEQAEKEYLAYLAKDFAGQWRVNHETSLFDYGIGESTLTYTDESFPRIHRTIKDLTPDQHTVARRNCEAQGLSGAELNACIYDNGFLNIPPHPRTVITDRTEGVVLAKIEKPVPVIKTNPDVQVSPDPVEKPVDEISPTVVKTKTDTDGTKTSKQVDDTPVIVPVEKKTNPISISIPKTKHSGSGGSLPNPVDIKTSSPAKTPNPVSKPTPVSKPILVKGKGL